MSLIGLIFKGEYSQLLISAVALLFMFYTLGRIIQKYFRFQRSNIYISIPIGLFAYTLLNQLVYTPILITGMGIDVLSIIDTLKAMAVLLFIFISYDAWLPSFSFLGIKAVSLSIASLLFVLLVYGMLLAFDSGFAPVDADWIASLDQIQKTDVYSPIGDDSFAAVMNGYQSTYYWIYLNSLNATWADTTGIAGNTEQVLQTAEVVRIEMALIWLTALTLSVQSSVINTEKSVTSHLVATGISTGLMISLGYLSPTSDIFYTLSLSIMIAMLLFDYSKRSIPSDTTMTIALLGTMSFSTIGTNSLSFILVFGLLIITLTAIRGGNIVRNTIHFLSLIVVFLAYCIVAMFFYDFALIKAIMLYIAVLAVVLLLMLLPLYSIGYTQSRRAELVQFEKSINNRIGTIVITTTVITTLLSLFIGFINDFGIFEQLEKFFVEFNAFDGGVWIGLSLYVFIILIPTAIILTFSYFGKKSTLLSLFAFFNLLLNPITLSSLITMFSIQFSGVILLIPSILILSIYSLGEITKRIPTLH